MHCLSQLFFLIMVSKFQNFVCIGCHDLTMLCLNISDFSSINVNDVEYCWIIYDISKFEAIILLENYVLHDRGYKYNACQSNQY